MKRSREPINKAQTRQDLGRQKAHRKSTTLRQCNMFYANGTITMPGTKPVLTLNTTYSPCEASKQGINWSYSLYGTRLGHGNTEQFPLLPGCRWKPCPPLLFVAWTRNKKQLLPPWNHSREGPALKINHNTHGPSWAGTWTDTANKATRTELSSGSVKSAIKLKSWVTAHCLTINYAANIVCNEAQHCVLG